MGYMSNRPATVSPQRRRRACPGSAEGSIRYSNRDSCKLLILCFCTGCTGCTSNNRAHRLKNNYLANEYGFFATPGTTCAKTSKFAMYFSYLHVVPALKNLTGTTQAICPAIGTVIANG